MRISTQQIYDTAAMRIGSAQTALAKTQQQVASGRKMLTPSDDPVAAARALDIAQSQALNAQLAANRVQVRNALTFAEGALASVTELLQQAREALVGAGNPALGDSQRASVALELESRLKAVLGLANTRDAQGNYIFAGFQTSTQPFVDTPTGVDYLGDAGQQEVQVDTSRRLALGNPGNGIFQGGGQDVFQTFKDAIAVLGTPVVTPGDRAALDAGLANGIGELDKALQSVMLARTSIGGRLQELDALDEAGADRDVRYQAMLSQIQDLDYTEALTRLSRQQVVLEAAQQSFVKTAGLSLFSFLR